jgi:hypothetical protein
MNEQYFRLLWLFMLKRTGRFLVVFILFELLLVGLVDEVGDGVEDKTHESEPESEKEHHIVVVQEYLVRVPV